MKNQNNSEFLNKKVVITGASSGIGLCAAIYFLNCGAKVIMGGRDVESMRNICRKNNFINATIISLDLKDDVQIIDFKSSIVELFGKIDLLINCAGVLLYGDVEKTFPQDFDYILDINIRSVYFLIYQLAGFMHKNSSIINMSCFYISSSYVNTNSLDYIKIPPEEKKDFEKKMEKNIPLGRRANPDDIVKIIVFLSSSKSKNITGQIIKVDGGRNLTSSGYVHYKGRLNMNSRVEPDGESTFYFLKNFAEKNLFSNEPPKDEKELEKYIEEKMGESSFSKKVETSYEINYTNANKYMTPKKLWKYHKIFTRI